MSRPRKRKASKRERSDKTKTLLCRFSSRFKKPA
nr:MAG TPA: hypothetical protein [Caudoviricetes sp.]